MKRTTIIILTIALLGIIGVIDKTQSSSHQLVSPSQTGAAMASNMSTPANSNSTTSSNPASYKDGTYTGTSEFTPYGTVQIAMVVSGGKITNVNFLQMPYDYPQSQQRTQYSEPLLKQTTLSSQSANIDFVSGATATSSAYQQSLQSAIDQATKTS